MSRWLLDVNVLIALIDPAHVQHDRAHEWFASIAGQAWATCPITENGVLRIVGSSRYPNSPRTPAAVLDLIAGLCAVPGHEFWADDISLFDRRLIDSTHLLDSAQLTDTYLLALARAHCGTLATLDRRLVPDAVPDGSESLHLIR